MVNLKNDDNVCFRWCHIRYLNQKIGQEDGRRIKLPRYSIVAIVEFVGLRSKMYSYVKDNGKNVIRTFSNSYARMVWCQVLVIGGDIGKSASGV